MTDERQPVRCALRAWRPGLFAATGRAALALLVAGCLAAATPAGAAKKEKKDESAATPEVLAPLFYPPLPQEPRYQFLGTITTTRNFKPKKGLKTMLFGDTRQVIEIERAYGVAMRGGDLYVCDFDKKMLLEFDLLKEEASLINIDHPQLALAAPTNIVMAPDGRKLVTDPRGGKIMVLDAEDRPVTLLVGNRVFDLGPEGGAVEREATCERPAMSPVAVGVYGNELFVLDIFANKVLVLDATTYCPLREFGTIGDAPGQFLKPTNLVVGPDGYVYVSDTVNARVQKFDRQGRHVQTIGSLGRLPGQFVRPKGVAVDKAGRLYVVDAATQRVQVFDAEGRLLIALGQPGNGRGGLDLPAGIAIADDPDSVKYAAALAAPGFTIEYLVLVTNHMGPNKVNLYGFGHLAESGQ